MNIKANILNDRVPQKEGRSKISKPQPERRDIDEHF